MKETYCLIAIWNITAVRNLLNKSYVCKINVELVADPGFQIRGDDPRGRRQRYILPSFSPKKSHEIENPGIPASATDN